MKFTPAARSRRGFLLMEAVLALMIFGIMAVAYTKTLSGLRRNSIAIQDSMALSQILNSALTETLTLPRLEEGDKVVDQSELGEGGQIITKVEPLELEDGDGNLLTEMFRVTVTAVWFQDGREQSQSLEGWRNSRLYLR